MLLLGSFPLKKSEMSLMMRNMGRTTDQDNLVNIGLVDLGVTEDHLDRVEGSSEEVLAQLLETSMSDFNGGEGGGGVFIWRVHRRYGDDGDDKGLLGFRGEG